MKRLQRLMSIYLLPNDLKNIHTKVRHILCNILDDTMCLCGLEEETHHLLFCVKMLFYFNVWMFICGLRDQSPQHSISMHTWMVKIQISMITWPSIFKAISYIYASIFFKEDIMNIDIFYCIIYHEEPQRISRFLNLCPIL